MQALTDVKAAAAVAKAGIDRGAGASGETDEAVREMSRFIATARSVAPDSFGSTTEQKISLIGYITGVVEYWANVGRTSKAQYLSNLRAVVAESGLLTNEEIPQLLDAFDELSVEQAFETGLRWSRQDCAEAAGKDLDFVPTGLARLASAA